MLMAFSRVQSLDWGLSLDNTLELLMKSYMDLFWKWNPMLSQRASKSTKAPCIPHAWCQPQTCHQHVVEKTHQKHFSGLFRDTIAYDPPPTPRPPEFEVHLQTSIPSFSIYIYIIRSKCAPDFTNSESWKDVWQQNVRIIESECWYSPCRFNLD